MKDPKALFVGALRLARCLPNENESLGSDFVHLRVPFRTFRRLFEGNSKNFGVLFSVDFPSHDLKAWLSTMYRVVSCDAFISTSITY